MDESLLPMVRAASSAVGVDFSVYREAMIRRRIEHRMRLRGCPNPTVYASLLVSEPAERWRLADAFLIKTTSAFRDGRTWDALRRVALPELITRCVRRDSTTLSAWVAGCATGEEAYCFAMAMLEARDTASVSIAVRVFATDIDPSALEHAARGLYAASAFANAPPQLAARFLRTESERTVAVTDELRDVVSLSRHSLTTSGAPVASTVFASFDVVSCCNVLLYFDDSTRFRAFSRLMSACEPGGVLVLGEAEYPPLEFQRSLVPVADGTHAFQVIR
jgi:chemotaxis methyl-accepting protein methylase